MIWLLVCFCTLWLLAYHSVSLNGSTLALAALLGGMTWQQGWASSAPWLWAGFALALLPLNLPFIRRPWLTRPVFNRMRKALPPISQTEREALEAGNTWWDAQLFSGRPDWQILQNLPPARLSDEERAFLDGPTEALCAMLDDWDITHHRRDLPPEVWSFIKRQGFWALAIPKRYGGLEFSHFAHSQVVMKIASRSVTAAVTVMVPNSLGPGKLLLAYGTEAQKNHYLPRLAAGDEIPAFALTGPYAGSDASAIPDKGVVCQGAFQGLENVLGIRLNWDKRYITLGPVATVLGLAFKLYDPERLLGETEDLGITLALIPTSTPGVTIGRRHFPLDSAFQNGPNQGRDVFIPLDWIIGGAGQAGKGWAMLMQNLATGRGISLPALAAAAAKSACRTVGAYARVREQFNRPIGEFEGVQQPLARMAGEAYLIDAARQVTAAALDQGQQPAVLSALLKYEATERMRRVINDGMDILGGAGIALGPRNFLGRLYQVIPVSITVEGANILTRSLMVFGQGAVRCHPFIQAEMAALHDPASGLARFDELLPRHIAFFLRNLASAAWLGLGGGTSLPGNRDTRRYYRSLARLSAVFAVAADIALLAFGGALKRKERLSGQLADALANLYLCSCALKHDQNQGHPEADRPLLDWACQHTLWQARQALRAVFRQLPGGRLWQALALPGTGQPPDDGQIPALAAILLSDTQARGRLTGGIYLNDRADDPSGRIEQALRAVLAGAEAEAKLHKALRQRPLQADSPLDQVREALALGILTPIEAELLAHAEQARLQAITVDDFDAGELTLGQAPR